MAKKIKHYTAKVEIEAPNGLLIETIYIKTRFRKYKRALKECKQVTKYFLHGDDTIPIYSKAIAIIVAKEFRKVDK